MLTTALQGSYAGNYAGNYAGYSAGYFACYLKSEIGISLLKCITEFILIKRGHFSVNMD